MKRTIVFEGEDADLAFKAYSHMNEAYGLLDEFENELRNRTKYGDGKPVSWEHVRDLYYDMKRGYDLPEMG